MYEPQSIICLLQPPSRGAYVKPEHSPFKIEYLKCQVWNMQNIRVVQSSLLSISIFPPNFGCMVVYNFKENIDPFRYGMADQHIGIGCTMAPQYSIAVLGHFKVYICCL